MNMRLPKVSGEWIDRSRPLSFRFEGESFQGFAGDTLTSALLANGVSLLGRSFKYHRPRGVLSFANHDVNVMLQQGNEPNVRGDVRLLQNGMDVKVVNTFFGTVKSDKGRCLGLISRLLPVGFYYKAFHTKALFPLWEKLFRFTTGLGEVDFSTPHEKTPKTYDFCDVLVIGAGPSGLAAALSAARQGADVALVDENARPGGSAIHQRGGDPKALERLNALLAQVTEHPKIRLFSGAYAAGYYKDHWVPIVEEKRMVKMRAGSVVIASGAIEQSAVFRNNDLPGVMLASACQRLIYRHGVCPVKHPLVLVANQEGYRAALDVLAQGLSVAAIVDLRPENEARGVQPLAEKLRTAGVPLFWGHTVVEALPGANNSIRAARIAPFAPFSGPAGEADFARVEEIACDGILMSVGWAGAAHLLYQAGTRMRYAPAIEQFVPAELPEGVHACGKVNGVHDEAARLLDGERAGSAAAAHAGFGEARNIEIPPEAASPSHPWPIVRHPNGKNFVDFDEDVQFQDIANAIQEGFDNIELLKRYSTSGMGPSQGKHSNMNVLRILARLTHKSPEVVGTTTARPPYHPVPMAILAGRGFHPQRHTPIHSRHAQAGAVWRDAALWQRPEYYRVAGKEREDCIRDEALAVRKGVGMIDVGTLGKLEIWGPQAAEFLERVYTARYANLKIGASRYALMCDEAGVIIDDGVVARLAEEHFYFTTTTSGAASIYRELSRLLTEWKMAAILVNHTGAYSAVNLAGPDSRAVLQKLTPLDLSGAAFPYLAAREGTVADIPARLLRVGFVGEWGYEIHVPARYGGALWDALLEAGRDKGIRPFGVEAQRLLRLEKGHIIIGQDSDGLTTPLELGMNWALKMDKPFFIGQRSLAIQAKKPLRQTLAGFTLPEDFSDEAPQECQLVIAEGEIAGRVTSVAFSPVLRRFIGLAFVRPEMNQPGAKFFIRLASGREIAADIAATPFYDPENTQQKEKV
jgi:sarcosine oxidase subunit alpha